MELQKVLAWICARGSARDGTGSENRARSRVRYSAGENLGDAAIAPIIHMQVIRRDESFEWNP
jgi:hypothetical protein